MPVNSVAQAALFCCLLLAASVSDIRTRTISDMVSVLLFCLGMPLFTFQQLSGILLALPLLLAALCRQGGMGGGDTKLTAAAGFVLGLPAGIFGLIVGLTACLLYFGIVQCIRKLRHMNTFSAHQTALPLVPFLSIGFIAAYLLFHHGGYFL